MGVFHWAVERYVHNSCGRSHIEKEFTGFK